MDLSYVILEYDCLGEIGPCLASLKKFSSGLACEYIVASNSRYDGELRNKVSAEFPEVHWIFNEKNGGFAYAMNRGLETAVGETVALLNADVRLMSDVAPAVIFLSSNPGVGLIGPKIVDEKGTLQDSARPFMTPWRALRRALARVGGGRRVLLERGFDYDRMQPVDWVIGAFMMAKKSAIEKVGTLDEQYFMYVEDMDWCRRFWEGGFAVHYFPELAVEFAGTRRSSAFLSGSGVPGRHAWIHLRSYLRFLRKFGCGAGKLTRKSAKINVSQ
jgi:N-acetylglucosaminyl-diphospho-decaprenol L-rhamnosyltransferase